MKNIIIILISAIAISFTSDSSYYSVTQKKADKSLAKLWEDKVINLSIIELSPNKMTELGIKRIELYKIQDQHKNKLGYVYFTEAPSKMMNFIHMTIFDENLKVHNVDVLRYPENYGSEICSKRFLKQFIGKYNGEDCEYSKNIDGISGATISSKSIILSVKKQSKNIVKLKQNKLI